MTDTTLTHDTVEIHPPIPPERIAWSVLFISFSAFCVLCAGVSIGLHYFLFQSSIPMGVSLQVGRNTARIIQNNGSEQAEINQREIGAGTVVVTDPSEIRGQSNLVFEDPTTNDLIALVTLKGGGTSVEMTRAIRPRFSWSLTNYRIRLTELRGDIEIRVSDDLNRDLDFIITTSDNTEIRLEPGGQYNISANEFMVRLTTHNEDAILITPDRLNARSVPEGYLEEYNLLTGEVVRSQPELVNLLDNPNLDVELGDEGEVEIAHWTCKNESNDGETFGHLIPKDNPDGLPSIELVRGDGVRVSGSTECTQEFNQTQFGIDVRDYNYLSARVTLYIQYQSVSRCGEKATECPLMLRLDFFPEGGTEQSWYHGIFARNDPAFDYPLWCEQCGAREPHVSIYAGNTYTYESTNLFDLFPAGEAPQYLSGFYFYASGHEYDVYVTEVSLYAGNIEPEDNIPLAVGDSESSDNG